MSRADSDPRSGFTLVEALVVLAASGIVLVSLARFFKDFNHAFDLREQVSERDQNAHYAVKRLSEALMSAGAGLPSQDWDVISMPEGNPGPRVRLGVNPRGGVQYLSGPVSGAYEVPVDDPTAFSLATAVLADPLATGSPTVKVPIDTAYNSGGFVNGIKPTPDGGRIRLTAPVTLQTGDALYAYDVEDYHLRDGNLMLGDMVLAENIQSLAISTLTVRQAATTQWSAMRSARVSITARTRSRDPRYPANQGYRKVDLSMDVLLRNRL